MLLTDRRQHFEALGWRHARGKGAQRRILDGRAIRQRVGERDPQLQRIGTGFNQGVDDFQRLFRAGSPRVTKGTNAPSWRDFSCANTLS
jgi:hypothetical protein